MRITWLISANITGKRPDEWDSSLASIRYRVLAPARYLANNGHQTHFLRFDQLGAAEIDLQIASRFHTDVVVISKVLAAGSVAAAERAKNCGAKVIVDLCDDHFDTPELAASYMQLCHMADLVTASTVAMARVIKERTGRTASVIDDPFEGPSAEPMFCPGFLSPTIKLAWFGHPVNFDTVLAMLPGLKKLALEKPISLEIVTDERAAQQSTLMHQLQKANGDGLSLQLTPWSLQATWTALANCDMVVVPSLPGQKKLVKSPNRVVEGLRAGRMVVAYPLPAYVELEEHLWLGDEIADGIRWAIANPEQVLAKIGAGQKAIQRRFSPEQAGSRWESALQQVVEQEELVL